jgi:hypothetical protein
VSLEIAAIRGSIERIAGEENFFRRVALKEDHVSSHAALEVVPEIVGFVHHRFGRLLGAEVVFELFRGERGRAAKVGLVADAADIEDRSRVPSGEVISKAASGDSGSNSAPLNFLLSKTRRRSLSSAA